MTTPLDSRTLRHLRAGLRFVAAAALVCLLSQGAAAQDTDDEGVLPVAGTEFAGEQPASGVHTPDETGGSGDQALTMAPAVLVSGDLQDVIDPAAARIEFETAAAYTELVTEAPAEEADFVADPPGIAAGDNGVGPLLQGSGQLTLREGVQARFVPAPFASKSMAVLVLDQDDGSSLAAELAGATKPELLVPLGPATSIDLTRLATITANFAGQLPGYHATIVFVSVDAGELHVSGVRAHTDGGPLDVLLH